MSLRGVEEVSVICGEDCGRKKQEVLKYRPLGWSRLSKELLLTSLYSKDIIHFNQLTLWVSLLLPFLKVGFETIATKLSDPLVSKNFFQNLRRDYPFVKQHRLPSAQYSKFLIHDGENYWTESIFFTLKLSSATIAFNFCFSERHSKL